MERKRCALKKKRLSSVSKTFLRKAANKKTETQVLHNKKVIRRYLTRSVGWGRCYHRAQQARFVASPYRIGGINHCVMTWYRVDRKSF